MHEIVETELGFGLGSENERKKVNNTNDKLIAFDVVVIRFGYVCVR